MLALVVLLLGLCLLASSVEEIMRRKKIYRFFFIVEANDKRDLVKKP